MVSFRRCRKVVPTHTEEELDAVQTTGEIADRTLLARRDTAKPGMTTVSLNEIAHQVITDADATPSFLDYEGFPTPICTSVNEVVVHNIPSSATILFEDDLVSIDCGAVLDGWHGDSALTFSIEGLNESVEKLNIATSEALTEGTKAMVSGVRLTDISYALGVVTREAELRHDTELGIIDGYNGHDVGCEVYMDPFLPNGGKAGKDLRIVGDSVLAIEPTLILGGEWGSDELDGGWAVISANRVPAFYWKHTVTATTDGPRILTPRHE